MTHPVRKYFLIHFYRCHCINRSLSDYENQRLHLLHKHGIDIGDSVMDGRKAKRMTPREIEQLMGGGDGKGGLFTWRDKHRRKVSSVNLFIARNMFNQNFPKLAYSV